MPQDARFALVANIRHFTSVLQNIDLPAGQQMAIRLLLADSQRRLAKLDAQAFRCADLASGQPPSSATPPRAPSVTNAPYASPLGAQPPSAPITAGHPASA